jgi:hypothetical protein
MDFWSKLKKGDNLYLLIPIYPVGKQICEYKYQETKVINMKEYKFIYRLTFKYTDENGKRIKVNLAINKNKCDLLYLPVLRETEWARDITIKYGDLIVTTFNDKLSINLLVDLMIDNRINECESIIENYKNEISDLETIKRNYCIYNSMYE